MVKRFGFGRKEKLKSRKKIEALFATGKSFPAFPLRVIYLFEPGEPAGLLVGVSASKRNFKKAVDRNRVKRLLREAYRLEKEVLLEKTKALGLAGNVFFMYNGKSIAGFDEISAAMKKALKQLDKIISNEKFS